jgi:hypothetical protein
MSHHLFSETALYRAAWRLIRAHGAAAAEVLCEDCAEESRRRGDVLSIVGWRALKGAVEHFENRSVH